MEQRKETIDGVEYIITYIDGVEIMRTTREILEN
jgi:hypothetical protein